MKHPPFSPWQTFELFLVTHTGIVTGPWAIIPPDPDDPESTALLAIGVPPSGAAELLRMKASAGEVLGAGLSYGSLDSSREGSSAMFWPEIKFLRSEEIEESDGMDAIFEITEPPADPIVGCRSLLDILTRAAADQQPPQAGLVDQGGAPL